MSQTARLADTKPQPPDILSDVEDESSSETASGMPPLSSNLYPSDPLKLAEILLRRARVRQYSPQLDTDEEPPSPSPSTEDSVPQTKVPT